VQRHLIPHFFLFPPPHILSDIGTEDFLISPRLAVTLSIPPPRFFFFTSCIYWVEVLFVFLFFLFSFVLTESVVCAPKTLIIHQTTLHFSVDETPSFSFPVRGRCGSIFLLFLVVRSVLFLRGAQYEPFSLRSSSVNTKLPGKEEPEPPFSVSYHFMAPTRCLMFSPFSTDVCCRMERARSLTEASIARSPNPELNIVYRKRFKPLLNLLFQFFSL